MSTLIVYAGKHGCTEDCAKKLAAQLDGDVIMVNLKERKLIDLTQYEKVIVGGSIYMGRVMKEVSEFCAKNLVALKAKKIGLFICCMYSGEAAETELNSSYPRELRSIAAACDYFGGRLRADRLNFMERFATKMVAKSEQSLPALDAKGNADTVLPEKISHFAQLINQA
ncbi:MAG: flavodoxin domain-containing protein [Acidobacteriota bacterium]